jgi:hypothetical protein
VAQVLILKDPAGKVLPSKVLIKAAAFSFNTAAFSSLVILQAGNKPAPGAVHLLQSYGKTLPRAF